MRAMILGACQAIIFIAFIACMGDLLLDLLHWVGK